MLAIVLLTDIVSSTEQAGQLDDRLTQADRPAGSRQFEELRP
jgi:hypothetical protein